MNIRRRLETLEGQRGQRQPESSPDTRRRMKAQLARAAELRRGGATVENNAELRAMMGAVEEARSRRGIRGEGRT